MIGIKCRVVHVSLSGQTQQIITKALGLVLSDRRIECQRVSLLVFSPLSVVIDICIFNEGEKILLKPETKQKFTKSEIQFIFQLR